MNEEIKTNKSTSKVIDSLHSQIDELKNELEILKASHNESKKRHTILSSRNDSLVDQLANYKHENEIVNALLKRKERRIADLEVEIDLLASESEALKLSVKNYKIRCDNLQESQATSAIELERLKIAYDAIVAAQGEYKRHYLEEIAGLTTELANYKEQSAVTLSKFMVRMESNDKDVDVLLNSLSSKRKALDGIYVTRNKAVMDYLAQLACAAKIHGEESRTILRGSIEIINVMREKYPEVQEKIQECSETEVDLDALLGESSACVESDTLETRLISGEFQPTGPSRQKMMKRGRHRHIFSRGSEVDGLDLLTKSSNNQRANGGGKNASNENNAQRSNSMLRSLSLYGTLPRMSFNGSSKLSTLSNLYSESSDSSYRGGTCNKLFNLNTNLPNTLRSSPQLPTLASTPKGRRKSGLSPQFDHSTPNQNKSFNHRSFPAGLNIHSSQIVATLLTQAET